MNVRRATNLRAVDKQGDGIHVEDEIRLEDRCVRDVVAAEVQEPSDLVQRRKNERVALAVP
jgi:hypothetical protein